MPDRVTRMRHEILNGSISRSMLSLALPVAASNLLQTLFNLTDGIWVGHLGPDALAAVSTGGFAIWAVFALMGLVSVGVTALVAQAIGAGDMERAARTAGQGFLLSIAIGVVIAVGGLASIDLLFAYMHTTPEVTTLGKQYLTPLLMFMPVLFGFASITAVFSGAGDTQTTMRLSGGAILFAIVLDPLLIYGWGPFPRLGVQGAALATVISRTLAVGIGMVMLQRRSTGIGMVFGHIHWPTWRTIARIGSPTSITGIVGSVIYVSLTRITTTFGTPAVAALGACHRLEGLSYLLAVGFAAAASAYVGQNLGASQPDRAGKGAWQAVKLVLIPVGILVASFITIPGVLLRAFTSDPAVLHAGTLYLRIVGISMMFQAMDLVIEGAFGGAGNTLPPMTIGVPFSLLRLPLAAFLAGPAGMGVSGVWLAISATSIVRGAIMAFWFTLGRWKRRRIG
jgi:putative MATE family efflux protein